MDIMLKRILSLLPQKEDGGFVRGAKKDFAKRIGYDSGDIVSMWINGSSTSYKKKIYAIAAEYNVSVEWLKGETDEKNKSTADNDDGLDAEIVRLFNRLSPEEQLRELAYLRLRVSEDN